MYKVIFILVLFVFVYIKGGSLQLLQLNRIAYRI